jgi:nucleolar protein 53
MALSVKQLSRQERRRKHGRRGNKKTLRGLDIGLVERGLTELARDERATGIRDTSKLDDSALFTVDTARAKKQSQKAATPAQQRLLNAKAKRDYWCSRESTQLGVALPHVNSRVPVRVSQTPFSEVQRATRKTRELERGRRALEARQQKDAKKKQANDAFFDLWQAHERDAVARKQIADASILGEHDPAIAKLRHRASGRKRAFDPKRVIATDAAAVSALDLSTAMSYRPPEEDHRRILQRAANDEIARIDRERQLQSRAPKRSDNAHGMLISIAESSSDDGDEEDDRAHSDEAAEQLDDYRGELLRTTPGASLKRWKKQQRAKRKAARLAAEQRTVERLERGRKRQREALDALDAIDEDVAHAMRDKRQRRDRVRERNVRRAGERKRIGGQTHRELPIPVLLPDEVPDTVRQLEPQSNAFADRLVALQRRNYVAPKPQRNAHARRALAPKARCRTYEANSTKDRRGEYQ